VKFALSNIALPAFDHISDLDGVAGLGFDAIEVAPSRVWRDTWHGLTTLEVNDYRRRIENAGLSVVGLHSLFYDKTELGLFKEPALRAQTLDFLEHLSKVCRDLGGRTLIYGSGRRRGELAEDEAQAEAVDFFGELTVRVESHRTCFCFEPLGPEDSDFINSGLESLAIVREVASPALAVQLDAKALVENDEATPELFREVADHLVHFHTNEPGLGVLGSTGQVDHAALGAMLREIGYEGYVSVEQKMANERDPLADIGKSAEMLKASYGDEGGHE
jgi:sugar phosphate isomerase/epimerase